MKNAAAMQMCLDDPVPPGLVEALHEWARPACPIVELRQQIADNEEQTA